MSAPIMLITGGSRGIGAATAQLAAAEGYDVAINYSASAEAAERVAEAVRAQGRRALTLQGDMAREDDIKAVFAKLDAEWGAPDCLVYSAGITGDWSRLDEVKTETLRHVLDINLLGAMIASKEAILRMSTRYGGKGGAIVHLASRGSVYGGPGTFVWYAASKGGIDALTIGLAREVAAEGIRVNAIQPGPTETDMMDPSKAPPGMMESIPMKRMGRPEEIAAGILFLASAEASFITGAILPAGGGR